MREHGSSVFVRDVLVNAHACTHARRHACTHSNMHLTSAHVCVCVCLCVRHHHVPVPMQSSDSKTRRPIAVLQHHELLSSSPVTYEHLYYSHVPALGRVVKAAPFLGIAFHGKRAPPPLQQHLDHLCSNVACCIRESMLRFATHAHAHAHAHAHTHAHARTHVHTQQAPQHAP